MKLFVVGHCVDKRTLGIQTLPINVPIN